MPHATITPKPCALCGKEFVPASPYPKAAAAQKYCSRVCSNTRTAKIKSLRAKQKPPEPPPEPEEKQDEGFNDIKLAVAQAYRRMVLERRIIPTDRDLYNFH